MRRIWKNFIYIIMMVLLISAIRPNLIIHASTAEISVTASVVADTPDTPTPKPDDPKPSEPKPTEPTPTDPKPADPTPSEPKPTPVEPKPIVPTPTPKPTPTPDEPTPIESSEPSEPEFYFFEPVIEPEVVEVEEKVEEPIEEPIKPIIDNKPAEVDDSDDTVPKSRFPEYVKPLVVTAGVLVITTISTFLAWKLGLFALLAFLLLRKRKWYGLLDLDCDAIKVRGKFDKDNIDEVLYEKLVEYKNLNAIGSEDFIDLLENSGVKSIVPKSTDMIIVIMKPDGQELYNYSGKSHYPKFRDALREYENTKSIMRLTLYDKDEGIDLQFNIKL